MYSVINRYFLLLTIFFVVANVRADDDGVSFDPSLLLGSGEDNTAVVDRLLNESELEEGEYSLDVYVNDRFHRRDVVTIAKKIMKVSLAFLKPTGKISVSLMNI
jgi:Fimbrial Usher protein.